MSIEVGKEGFARMTNLFISEKEHAYWEGVASRQAEVCKLQAEINELQKRIDEALRELMVYKNIQTAVTALKGSQNEN